MGMASGKVTWTTMVSVIEWLEKPVMTFFSSARWTVHAQTQGTQQAEKQTGLFIPTFEGTLQEP